MHVINVLSSVINCLSSVVGTGSNSHDLDFDDFIIRETSLNMERSKSFPRKAVSFCWDRVRLSENVCRIFSILSLKFEIICKRFRR